MLSGVCVGTNDLNRASEFYDRVLATIGMSRVMENEREIGYAAQGQDAQFYLLLPYNELPATNGNGTQVMFAATSTDEVKAFHYAALNNGGTDDGKPGPRDYQDGYYGAYCRDIDGNKLHVYTIEN